MEGAGSEVAGVMAITKVAALAYMMFNLFTPPCFAAIGAMNSEMKSAKWLWGAVGFQLGVGYTVAYLVYTVGTLITDPASLQIVPALAGGIAVLIFVLILTLLLRLPLQTQAPLTTSYLQLSSSLLASSHLLPVLLGVPSVSLSPSY
jgi:ferrous iron transport protein B